MIDIGIAKTIITPLSEQATVIIFPRRVSAIISPNPRVVIVL